MHNTVQLYYYYYYSKTDLSSKKAVYVPSVANLSAQCPQIFYHIDNTIDLPAVY